MSRPATSRPFRKQRRRPRTPFATPLSKSSRTRWSQLALAGRRTDAPGSPNSYAVTLSADGPGGTRVAELNGFANSIQPGQTATVDAVGSVSGEAPEGLTCTVVNVNRF